MEQKAANYLLRYFPSLWRQAEQQAEDAIEGKISRSLDTIRRGRGGHSDTTAARALKLAEARTLAETIAPVRKWIDNKLPPADRPLLLAVWRQGAYGWYWVSKDARISIVECKTRWDRLCDELANWLS